MADAVAMCRGPDGDLYVSAPGYHNVLTRRRNVVRWTRNAAGAWLPYGLDSGTGKLEQPFIWYSGRPSEAEGLIAGTAPSLFVRYTPPPGGTTLSIK
jgi:hypothetical protein